jgi:hypothetical protein
LVAAASSAPLLVRTALLIEKRGTISAPDLAGFLSDIAVSLLVAGASMLAARLHALLAFVTLFVWSLLQYGNYEHVSELGAGLQFTFAGYLADPTFLLGSALSPTRPILLAATLLLPLALAIPALRPGSGTLPLWRISVSGLLLGVLAAALPGGTETLGWRRSHFAQESLARLLRSGDEPTAVHIVTSTADLDGEPIVSLPAPRSNVMLLILEGLPALVVDAIAERYGVTSQRSIASLSRAAERGLVATNFVLHQRQTNRGMYSLLCGDYPKLDPSVAKMTLYLKDSARDCLPRVLARASYETVFLQGAPLPFMFKDAFTRLAGFDQIYGDKDFVDPFARSYWGVDDRSLLLRALDIVRELESGATPWFLTVLSVGTHHPAVVPADYVKDSSRTEAEAAIAYLDEALAEFIASLEAEGVLDDTLVIITSDESRGEDLPSDLHTALSASWGPLVALVPGAGHRLVEAPFGQSDVALSIVDFLGLDVSATQFIGRSIFRRYAEPRRIYFANVFHRRTGVVDAEGSLVYCDEAKGLCSRYAADPFRLFAPSEVATRPSPAEIEDLRSAVATSLANAFELGESFSFELIQDRYVPVLTVPRQQLFYGQNLDLPPSSRVDVDIELRVEGKEGQLDLDHYVREKMVGDHVMFELKGIRPGEGAVFRYAFRTVEAMKNVKLALNARTDRSGVLGVRFRRARISVSPLRSTPTSSSRMIGRPEVRVLPPGSRVAAGSASGKRPPVRSAP